MQPDPVNEIFKFLQNYWWGFVLLEIFVYYLVNLFSNTANNILLSVRAFWREQNYLIKLLWSKENSIRKWQPRTNQFITLHAIRAGSAIDSLPLIDTLENKVKRRESVLVLGKPGSGKTTSLKTLAEKIAIKTFITNCAIWLLFFSLPSIYIYNISLYSFIAVCIPLFWIASISTNLIRQSPLPFFIELRRFHDVPDLDTFLSQQTKKLLSFPEFIINKRCIFLLDGVNEITSEHYQKFINSWESQSFILTSRIGEEPLIDIQNIVTVKELDDAGVIAFIKLNLRTNPTQWAFEESLKLIIEKKIKFLKDNNLLLENGIGRNPFWLKMLVTTNLETPNQGSVFYTFAKNLIEHSISLPLRKRDPLWKEIVPVEVEMEALGNLALEMTKTGNVGFEGRLDWESARSTIRDVLGDRKESMDDVLFEAQSATLLNVEYRNRIEFSHQLVQEFFTAYALQDKSQWDLALKNINDKNWWRAITMVVGLVSDPSIQGSGGKFKEFIKMVLELNTPFSLILAVALKGSTTVKGEALCLEIAKKFGLWPKQEHVRAINNISLIIPEPLINGMVEIGNLEVGYAKRVGYLLIAIYGNADLLINIYSRPNSLSVFHRSEIIPMAKMAPPLGVWGLMPSIYESIRTGWNFYHLLRGKKIVKKLIEIAFSNGEVLQKEALKALGEMQNLYLRVDLPNKKTHFPDQHSEFRNIFQDLGSDILVAICILTEHKDIQIKVKSLELLKWTDDPAIIPYMRKAFSDSSNLVRIAAANSLWFNRTPPSIALLCEVLQKEHDALVQIEIVKSMEMSPDASVIPVLLNLIKTSSNNDVQLNALNTLSKANAFIRENREGYKDEEIKVINDLLSPQFSGEIRATAIGILWNTLEDKTPLLSYINDSDDLVREEVVSWSRPLLRLFGETEYYVDVIKRGLVDKSVIVRRKAIECLSEYDDEIISELIKNLRKETDKEYRTKIIRKLGFSRSILAIPVLSSIIIKYTQKLKPFNLEFFKKEEKYSELEDALNALGNIDSQESLNILLKVAKHENAKFRVYAAKALSEAKSEIARKALEGISRGDPDKVVREEASKSLGIIGNEETINILRKDAESDVAEVKQIAVDVLKDMETDDALNILMKNLYDPNEDVRISSIEGVCKLSYRNIENLKLIIPLISDPSQKVSVVAVWCLTYILTGQELDIFKIDFAREIIQRIKFSNSRFGAKRIQKDLFDAFMELMKTRDQIKEIEKLEHLLTDEIAQKLLLQLQHPDSEMRAVAAKALGKLQVQESLPNLEKMFLDENLDVILAAAQGINDINPDYLPEYAD